MERLYRFLNALGKEVEIVVRSPATRRVEPGVHVLTPDRRQANARKNKRRLASG